MGLLSGSSRKLDKQFGPAKRYSVLSDKQIEHSLMQMSKPRSSFASKLVRALAWVVALTMVVGTGLNAYYLYRNTDRTRALTTMIDQQYNPAIKVRYSQLGQQVIDAWYNGGVQPVPLDPSVNWPSLSKIQQPIEPTEQETRRKDVANPAQVKGDYLPVVKDIAFLYGVGEQTPYKDHPNSVTERLVYTVDMDGVLQNVTVLFRIPDLANIDDIPTLVAAPSIENPVDPSLNLVPEESGPVNLRNWKVSTQQAQELEDWAKAYVADDRQTLKRLSGDMSKDAVYVGIAYGNYAYVPGSLKVVWSKLSDRGDSGFARITFDIETVIPTGFVSEVDGSPIYRKIVQSQTMDILARGQNTALLQVVSWGPAGTYNSLSVFSVAETAATAPENKERYVLEERAGGSSPQSGATDDGSNEELNELDENDMEEDEE